MTPRAIIVSVMITALRLELDDRRDAVEFRIADGCASARMNGACEMDDRR